MNKFVLFALVAASPMVMGEPPVNYGAPQQYSAPAPQYNAPSSLGYSDFGGASDDYVDDALLSRVVQLIGSSNRFAYSAPSSSYGSPTNSYGAPSTRGSSGGVILGRPERAQRVAEFDLGNSYRNGGYSQGGYN